MPSATTVQVDEVDVAIIGGKSLIIGSSSLEPHTHKRLRWPNWIDYWFTP